MAVFKKFKPLNIKRKEKIKQDIDDTTDQIMYIDSPSSNNIEQIKNEESFTNSSECVLSIDSNMKMTNNPFDILKNTPYKIEPHKETGRLSVSQPKSDDFILSYLKKPKAQQEKYKIVRKIGIFKKIAILSKNELVIPSKRYYKFPFDISVINDESPIFNILKEELVNALASAYSNYRKFGESFKVLLNEELLIFSDTVTCSPFFSKLLISNGIQFSKEKDVLIIDKNDIGLVYDVIINIEIPKGKSIPFIISEFEFENGIVFRTKIKKGPVVRSTNGVEYSYTLYGPLYSFDYTFDDDVFLEYM